MRDEFIYNNDILHLLVSQSAIDFDNQTLGKNPKSKSVLRLSKSFYDLSRKEYINVATMNLLVRSIGIKNFKSTHVNELPYQANLIARELENYQQLSKERLETMKEFCYDLNQNLIYEQSAHIRKRRLAA